MKDENRGRLDISLDADHVPQVSLITSHHERRESQDDVLRVHGPHGRRSRILRPSYHRILALLWLLRRGWRLSTQPRQRA